MKENNVGPTFTRGSERVLASRREGGKVGIETEMTRSTSVRKNGLPGSRFSRLPCDCTRMDRFKTV